MRKPKEIGIQKIAAMTGVSMSTVSRALNNRSSISPETAALVLRAAREIGYQIPMRRKAVAVILPGSEQNLSWYGISMLNALREAGSRQGFLLELISADQLELLNERAVQGIVSFDFSRQLANYISADYPLPMLCINDTGRHIDGVFSVFSDDRDAISKALTLLVGFGHKKIALFTQGSPENADNRFRTEAFEELCRVHRLDSASTVLPNPGGTGNSLYYNAVLELKRRGITAVINSGESSAVECLHALRYCKFRVPEDISLVTWEMPKVSQFLSPRLTTVQQDFPTLAERTFEALTELIQGNPPQGDILIPYLLNLRDSVGLPPEQ